MKNGLNLWESANNLCRARFLLCYKYTYFTNTNQVFKGVFIS